MNDRVILNLQLACKNLHRLPTKKKFKSWVRNIFLTYNNKIELTIRIVDIKEMHYLNWYYLGKNFPTNILSFPFSPPLGITSLLLGDIVICRQIIEYEAKKHNISFHTHWAHMIIHGSLHLLGYNHILEKDAKLMEKLEINMIKKMGYKTCCYSINN